MKMITKIPEMARKAYYHLTLKPIIRPANIYPTITPKGAESKAYANF